jgi:NADPH-dependent 2,4-dienoyl-CoA reductase/sulfur reductase-like enzyme
MIRTDIAIVGAGPAGIAAAVRAAECGKQVTVLDDNRTEGGQIWRGGRKRAATSGASNGPGASKWFRGFAECGAKLLPGARVVAADAARRTLRAETSGDAFDIEYDRLILATGARELFLPFPGWTLPNVTGVGAMQALVKSGLPVEGKRIVVAGSGPLLLAVAAHLREAGAIVPAIVEQAGWKQLTPFLRSLLGSPAKLLQAASLRFDLGATPYRTDSWVAAAEGDTRVRTARIQTPSGIRTLDCDYLAVAYGLVPNVELAAMLGCRIAEGSVTVDEYQQTALPGIFCAGESTGIGGVELSLAEGEIAGYAAAGHDAAARRLFATRRKAARFAQALNLAFTPRPELRRLPEPGTLVCRCEDVPFCKLQTADSWRAAKLHLRCGMGPCQGRVCGPATNFLFGWAHESVRPPLFPARIATLLSEKENL